jgi:replicative DNA helicase
MYESGRYLTVTGNHLPGTPTTIEHRQEEMDAVHAEMFAERNKPWTNGKVTTPSVLPNLDDKELLDKAFNAKNGEDIFRLYHGDTSKYGSPSEADLALCNHLVFYAGPDPQKVDRIFRASDLYRPKWDDQRGNTTYGQMTINKAIEEATEFYSRNGHSTIGGSPASEPAIPTPPVWEPPQPFESVDVPDFPVDAFPFDVANYVSQEAVAKQVPVDLPGCLVIGGVAVAAGGKCNVYLSRDWQEPVNEFIVSVLPSGERKSPSYRSVLKPVEDVERELVEQQTPEILKKKTERDILEKRLQTAKTDAAKGKGDAQTTAEAEARGYAEELARFVVPEAPRLLADDATPEAVAGLLAEQKGRLAIASTEGGIFDIVGGRYSDSTPNLDVYLKGYSGDTLRVDRHSRPPEFVPTPALTVILTVQPDVIADLASRKAFRGRGFLARWLYSLPKSLVGYRSVDAQPVAEEVRQWWDAMLRAILALPVPESGNIPLIHLSPQAHDLLRTFRQELEIELRPGEELDDLADWGNKLSGNVARLAGILHVTEWAVNSMCTGSEGMYTEFPWDCPVTPRTMESAIRLGWYFKGHAQAAFALMGADARIGSAKKVWAAIQKHNPDAFTVRDLWQKVRRGFSGVSQLEQVLNLLEELGYVRRVESQKREGPGQSPSPSYEVNPLARTQNTQCTQNRGIPQQMNGNPRTRVHRMPSLGTWPGR